MTVEWGKGLGLGANSNFDTAGDTDDRCKN